MNQKDLSLLLLLLGGGLLLLFPEWMPDRALGKGAGLALITIGLFATARIPEYLTALLFFSLAMLFRVAPAEVVFSGFQSTALWLVFGGLVIGIAMNITGLGKRIASQLASHLEGSYLRLIAGMVLVGLALAFVMPSAMGRIMLLIPVALALASHFGFEEGSHGRTGLVLAATLGTFIPAFTILPANVVNMILVGMAESQYQFSPLFGEYLLLLFPILGLMKALLIVLLVVRYYPDQPRLMDENEIGQSGAISREERTLGIVLVLLLSLWVIDFIHHISPAWIGLAGAVYLLLPKVGVVSGEQFNQEINYAPLFVVAGVIGLGGVIHYAGLGSVIGTHLIANLPLDPATPFINYLSVSLIATVTGLVTTLPGIPAVMTPLTGELAEVTGFSPAAILMMQMVGISSIIFPYQAPPLIVALQLAGVKVRAVFKLVLMLALASYLLFIPLNYLWWQWLGWL